MNDQPQWNDAKREELRAALRTAIWGEVRLARYTRDEILDTCCEVPPLGDECPAEECDAFDRFAAEEYDRATASLATEMGNWPAVTDCDRLDRAEHALRERGIVFWQASPCCDTCTYEMLPSRIEKVDSRHPGFERTVRGYAFFIDQNLREMLAEGTRISVYLAYGRYPSEDADVDPQRFEQTALSIARKVSESLRGAGLAVDWNGEFSRKIGVSLNWQRRSRLE